MTDPVINFAEARGALSLTPAPGAKARIFAAIHEPRAERVRHPLRLPVIAFALLVSATAAAVGGPPLLRWSTNALAAQKEKYRASPAAPTSAKGGTTKARGATPAAPSATAPDPAELIPTPSSPSSAASIDAPTTQNGGRSAARHDDSSRSASDTPASQAARDSALAEEVAAYREAAALVASSPGLAIVRLRAHRDRFPKSALGEEVSLRLVQAFGALGRDADARREAQSFVVRYPHSAKYRELRAIADGAPVRRPEE